MSAVCTLCNVVLCWYTCHESKLSLLCTDKYLNSQSVADLATIRFDGVNVWPAMTVIYQALSSKRLERHLVYSEETQHWLACYAPCPCTDIAQCCDFWYKAHSKSSVHAPQHWMQKQSEQPAQLPSALYNTPLSV